MKYVPAMLLLGAALACGQSGVRPPVVGCFLDGVGMFRPVVGMASNFILGDATESEVLSAACSGRAGLVKTENALEVFDEHGELLTHWATPGGPAVFAFSPDGLPLFAYLTSVSQLWQLRGSQPSTLPLPAYLTFGEVLSLASDGETWLVMVVKRDTGLWLAGIALPTLQLQGAFPLRGVQAPVLLRPDGTIAYSDGQDVVVWRMGAGEQRIRLDAPAAGIAEMGKDWLHVWQSASDGRATGHVAVRLREGAEEHFRLPEVAR